MGIRQGFAVVVMVLASGMMAGCRVDKHEREGGDQDVKISTPFGGMSVKTNGAMVTGETGIDVYPGAQLVTKNGNEHGNDGAADVNMSFGRFSLRVKAANYRTSDGPDKVKAFYKSGLAKFGTVIECSHGKPVGAPHETGDGLTCGDDKGHHVDWNSDSSKVEFKTGSKQHQHLVTVDPDGGGTKIGLVALDLPGSFSGSDDPDSDKGKGERKQ